MPESNINGDLKNHSVPAGNSMQVADFYEYSMAHANVANGVQGRQSIFNASLRGMPTSKVVGHFEHKGVKYPELAKRHYMINAGLEQVVACLLSDNKEAREKIVEYFRFISNREIPNEDEFFEWVLNFKFQGDIHAMEEGIPFFAHQPLVKLFETFEGGQVYESVILSILNRQVNVATTSYDVYLASNKKVLLEGASRRAFGLEDSLNVSRAAMIGGFSSSSNIKFGMEYNKKVGGTHGHSYVLSYGSEYEAFKAQSKIHSNNVTFLLDTYGDIKTALFTALKVAREDNLTYFKFRLDSGELHTQSKWIHEIMSKCSYSRESYDVVASDDLNAGKVKFIEKEGGDILCYLLGTFLSIQSKGPGIVYKITAKKESDTWKPVAKFSEDPGKATLGGDIQVYRIMGKDGFYARDVIALMEEPVGQFLNEGESAKPLLIPFVKEGVLSRKMPTLDEIIKRREEEMSKFKDIENYLVLRSKGVVSNQENILKEIKNKKKNIDLPSDLMEIYEAEVLNKIA